MKLALPRGIGPRLFLSFGLLVGLLLLVAAVCLVRLASLNREFSTIVVDRHSRTEVLKEVTDAQQQMMRLVNHLLIVDAKPQIDADLARIEDAKRSIGERLEQLDKASEADDLRGKALQREAQERNGAYLVNLVRFTRQIVAGQRAEARALLADQLEAQMDASLAAMTHLSHAQTALMHRAQQEAQESYETARVYVWAISVAAALLSIVVATVIARGITRPLGAAARLADSVAAGDLTSRVAAPGNDETARLMQALARMTESLTRIVSGVRRGSDNIAGTAHELLTGNAQLTQRAEEQASSLEETAATLEELTTTVRRNAEHAGEANRLATATSDVALRAGQSVDLAVERMGAITMASRKIADITHVINAIAFQTNILALNAAVEAARAGEQGRGFAVVAAEVRSLAQRSANAAKEIGDLIATAVREVEGGAKLVNDAGRTMGEVVEGIGAVAAHVRDISGASRDQSEAIEQVNKALAEIDQVTQRNAALAEETAAAVASLEQQARALVESVGVFQLAEGAAPAPAPRMPATPAAWLQKQTARSPAPLPRLRPALAVTKAAR